MFSLRSLPNLLGLLRIITTPLLAWLILLNQPAPLIGAVVLLLLMALSDMADGKLARKLKVVSPLGIFLDTISDKIFVVGALIPMIETGMISGWIVFIIVIREFVVSGLRSFAAAEGEVISAGQWGKQKLAITVVALIWRLLAAAAAAAGMSEGIIVTLLNLWPISMGLALFWTIGSGVEYLWRSRKLLMSGWTPIPNQK